MASPRAILGLGWCGLCVYGFPGYLSFDSVWQLEQARTGELTDWHPPVMAALWRVVELVIAGPFGMFALQSVCFLAGAYLLLRRAMPERAAAWCTVGLAWFPPIATTLAVIWKDSQMAGFLLLGTALLVERRNAAALALLALGTAMRHNAFTITLPIVVLLLAFDRFHHVGWRRYAIAAATWLAITLLAQLANRVLTVKPEHPWQQSVAMMDIAGTLRYARPISDDELREQLAGMPLATRDGIQERARKSFRPAWMWNEITGPEPVFHPAKTDAEIDAIGRAWRSIVFGHPGAYLRYRWHVFRKVLSPPGISAYIWFTDVQDLPGSSARIAHDAAPSWIQDRLRDVMYWSGGGLLYRPWIFALGALWLVPLCWRDRVQLTLLLSAISSEIALWILAPTPDFRYSIWLVVVTLLVAIQVVAVRLRRPT